jgi:Fur family peroxide stress response transcriptional regulator
MTLQRNSIQRQLVLDAVKTLHNHPTAQEVYDLLKPGYPEISLGTVYRNLNLLAEQSRLRKISVPDAADRFDHTLPDHYHLRCSACGEYFDIDARCLAGLNERVSQATGMEVHSHSILFTGTCQKCAGKNE